MVMLNQKYFHITKEIQYMKLGIGTRCQNFIAFYIPIRLYFSQYRSISLTCTAHVSPHHFIKAHVVVV